MMWAKIISFFASYFRPLKSFYAYLKGFFTPINMLFLSVILFLAISSFYLFNSNLKLRERQKIYAQNQIGLNAEIFELKELNTLNLQIIKEKESKYYKTLQLLEELHKESIQKEKDYARQKEKNSYSKDGDIAPVLLDTLRLLLQRSAN